MEGFPSVVAVVPAEHPLVCDTHPPSTYLLFDRRFGKAIAGGVKKISSPPRPWKRLAVSPDPEIGTRFATLIDTRVLVRSRTKNHVNIRI